MSKFDEVHVRWTAQLIDPSKTKAVGDGSGFTPDEAMESLRRNLRWKVERERKSASQIEAALEVALAADLDMVRHG